MAEIDKIVVAVGTNTKHITDVLEILKTVINVDTAQNERIERLERENTRLHQMIAAHTRRIGHLEKKTSAGTVYRGQGRRPAR
ncbi:MAG: hypothetical protein ACXABY_14035 [Candidatus Thorarchaeota archaeon]|jgi:hypothetical protein